MAGLTTPVSGSEPLTAAAAQLAAARVERSEETPPASGLSGTHAVSELSPAVAAEQERAVAALRAEFDAAVANIPALTEAQTREIPTATAHLIAGLRDSRTSAESMNVYLTDAAGHMTITSSAHPSKQISSELAAEVTGKLAAAVAAFRAWQAGPVGVPTAPVAAPTAATAALAVAPGAPAPVPPTAAGGATPAPAAPKPTTLPVYTKARDEAIGKLESNLSPAKKLETVHTAWFGNGFDGLTADEKKAQTEAFYKDVVVPFADTLDAEPGVASFNALPANLQALVVQALVVANNNGLLEALEAQTPRAYFTALKAAVKNDFAGVHEHTDALARRLLDAEVIRVRGTDKAPGDVLASLALNDKKVKAEKVITDAEKALEKAKAALAKAEAATLPSDAKTEDAKKAAQKVLDDAKAAAKADVAKAESARTAAHVSLLDAAARLERKDFRTAEFTDHVAADKALVEAAHKARLESWKTTFRTLEAGLTQRFGGCLVAIVAVAARVAQAVIYFFRALGNTLLALTLKGSEPGTVAERRHLATLAQKDVQWQTVGEAIKFGFAYSLALVPFFGADAARAILVVMNKPEQPTAAEVSRDTGPREFAIRLNQDSVVGTFKALKSADSAPNEAPPTRGGVYDLPPPPVYRSTGAPMGTFFDALPHSRVHHDLPPPPPGYGHTGAPVGGVHSAPPEFGTQSDGEESVPGGARSQHA